jgi:hypothetical protein
VHRALLNWHRCLLQLVVRAVVQRNWQDCRGRRWMVLQRLVSRWSTVDPVYLLSNNNNDIYTTTTTNDNNIGQFVPVCWLGMHCSLNTRHKTAQLTNSLEKHRQLDCIIHTRTFQNQRRIIAKSTPNAASWGAQQVPSQTSRRNKTPPPARWTLGALARRDAQWPATEACSPTQL